MFRCPKRSKVRGCIRVLIHKNDIKYSEKKVVSDIIRRKKLGQEMLVEVDIKGLKR